MARCCIGPAAKSITDVDVDRVCIHNSVTERCRDTCTDTVSHTVQNGVRNVNSVGVFVRNHLAFNIGVPVSIDFDVFFTEQLIIHRSDCQQTILVIGNVTVTTNSLSIQYVDDNQHCYGFNFCNIGSKQHEHNFDLSYTVRDIQRDAHDDGVKIWIVHCVADCVAFGIACCITYSDGILVINSNTCGDNHDDIISNAHSSPVTQRIAVTNTITVKDAIVVIIGVANSVCYCLIVLVTVTIVIWKCIAVLVGIRFANRCADGVRHNVIDALSLSTSDSIYDSYADERGDHVVQRNSIAHFNGNFNAIDNGFAIRQCVCFKHIQSNVNDVGDAHTNAFCDCVRD